MKDGDDGDKKKSRRTIAHEVAVERRETGGRLLAFNCGLTARFRGGPNVIYYKPGKKHRYTRRVSSDDRLVDTMGLDMIISDPEIRPELWVQMDPRGEKQVRMFPNYDIFRTTAPSSGPPTDSEVKEFFKDQWVLNMLYYTISYDEPFLIGLAPFAPLVKLGKDVGYYFPEHKGRISTVHWYTEPLEKLWRFGYIPGSKYDKDLFFSSISKTGMGQPDVIRNVPPICKVIREILKEM